MACQLSYVLWHASIPARQHPHTPLTTRQPWPKPAPQSSRRLWRRSRLRGSSTRRSDCRCTVGPGRSRPIDRYAPRPVGFTAPRHCAIPVRRRMCSTSVRPQLHQHFCIKLHCTSRWSCVSIGADSSERLALCGSCWRQESCGWCLSQVPRRFGPMVTISWTSDAFCGFFDQKSLDVGIGCGV